MTNINIDEDIFEVELPTIEEVAEAIEFPSSRWRNACHAISLRVVRSGILGEPGPRCRVVRGVTSGYGIGSQHSWIALGYPYDPATIYIDVTAHTWGEIEGIVLTSAEESFHGFMSDNRGHAAHGYDPRSIWDFGRPEPATGEVVDLELPPGPGRTFVELLGPLDAKGWESLAMYPKGGWPYREVINALARQHPDITDLLPIDIIGNGTDTNPSNLYW